MNKILIVDDSILFREVLRQALHSRLPALMISEAVDRKEALGMIPTLLPDLIFMDIRLPDGSGLELTRQIKDLFPDMKIVILTNYDEPEYRKAALHYADHYVSKDAFMNLLDVVLPETGSILELGQRPRDP